MREEKEGWEKPWGDQVSGWGRRLDTKWQEVLTKETCLP